MAYSEATSTASPSAEAAAAAATSGPGPTIVPQETEADPVLERNKVINSVLSVLGVTCVIGCYLLGMRTFFAVAVGLTAFGLAMLYKHQRWLLYLPHFPRGADTAAGIMTLEQMGLPPNRVTEHRYVAADGVKLHGMMYWYEGPRDEPESTIVFFHGNAGNNSHRLPYAMSIATACRANVFLAEYRGYGASDGVPSEEGLQQDAVAALEHVLAHDEVNKSRVIVMGRSLGGAVAAWLAMNHGPKIHGLILENTFTGIPDMIDALMPVFRPVKALVTNNWETCKFIDQLRMPILFISSKYDEIVPPVQMRQLYEAATGCAFKHWQELEATHNDTLGRDGHVESIHRFLLRVFSSVLQEPAE